MTPVARMFEQAKSLPVKTEQDRLVVSNLGLVVKMCQKITGGYDDDSIQNGMLGLIRAANTFEPERGFRFSTYACRCIWSAIVGPYNVDRRRNPPMRSLDSTVLNETLAGRLGLPPDDAVRNERRVSEREQLTKALQAMDEVDRACVIARYIRGEKLKTIGERWGITKERARQRINRGLREGNYVLTGRYEER